MMRDVAIEEVKGTRVSFIAVFLMLFGAFQLLLWASFFFVATALALLCGLVWVGVAISIAYILLGFGLLRRRQWAFTWTPVLMVIMIVLNVLTVVFVGPFQMMIIFGPMIVVHVLILAVVLWERGRFVQWPMKRVHVTRPLDRDRVKGLKCEECGSQNLTVYPDGSGICGDCRHVFSDARKGHEED